jgi:hypothetical protein
VPKPEVRACSSLLQAQTVTLAVPHRAAAMAMDQAVPRTAIVQATEQPSSKVSSLTACHSTDRVVPHVRHLVILQANDQQGAAVSM